MDKLDKIARIALAIQRGGGDHLGPVESIHRDFLELLKLIPKDVTSERVAPASERSGDVEQQAQEENLQLPKEISK